MSSTSKTSTPSPPAPKVEAGQDPNGVVTCQTRRDHRLDESSTSTSN